MLFTKFFYNAKILWLYYVILLAINVGVVLIALKLPQLYVDKRPVPQRLWALAIGALVAVMGFMLADAKGAKLVGLIVAPIVCGVVAAFTIPVIYRLVTQAIGVSRTVSLTMGQVILFTELAVLDCLIVYTSWDAFEAGKALRVALAVVMVLVTAGLVIVPFARDFARAYLRPYAFLCEPSVYVNGADCYSVLFATTGPGTGTVTITKDGVTTIYNEEDEGVILYDRQIHRIDLKRSDLDGATYFVSSRQTKDGTDKVWRMGKEIRGKEYKFRAAAEGADVKFLVVSDNQGATSASQVAVRNAYEKYGASCDFVLMLGDHAESYNDVENDIIEPLLKVSALASGSVMPVYYTLGNHEYRGMIAPYLWSLIPTGSETGEQYYTFAVKDAFFTVLNFANDHDDDFYRFAGLANYNAYKDREYEWYTAAMAGKPYEDYTYNLVLSHIAMIAEDSVPAYEHVCEDCGVVHDYKFREFAEKFTEYGVQYVVSGHSHVPPEAFTSKTDHYDFPNLHAGSNYNNKTCFRNSIVTLSGGKVSYEVYGEKSE